MGKSLSREVYVINDSWESHPPFNFFFFFFYCVFCTVFLALSTELRTVGCGELWEAESVTSLL